MHHNIVYIVTVHNHIRAIESKLPLVACGKGMVIKPIVVFHINLYKRISS